MDTHLQVSYMTIHLSIDLLIIATFLRKVPTDMAYPNDSWWCLSL